MWHVSSHPDIDAHLHSPPRPYPRFHTSLHLHFLHLFHFSSAYLPLPLAPPPIASPPAPKHCPSPLRHTRHDTRHMLRFQLNVVRGRQRQPYRKERGKRFAETAVEKLRERCAKGGGGRGGRRRTAGRRGVGLSGFGRHVCVRFSRQGRREGGGERACVVGRERGGEWGGCEESYWWSVWMYVVAIESVQARVEVVEPHWRPHVVREVYAEDFAKRT
ncbi:hypothetical protein IQ07DRAFT_234924 [Pyrenochaeta sp. DS3sAY3a]|nr:hypothetical protein IQ07DRAFT_234924 [Pyrenochaeta sp. DS3sAY3a]